MATFVTSRFGEWRRSWHGMPMRSARAGALVGLRRDEDEGILAALDADSGNVVYSCTLDSPAGFAAAPDRLFVNSMHGNRVICIDQKLQVIDIFATRMMNDLHSLVLSSAGLLITSSGTDAILELSLDGEGVWQWLAAEHGYGPAPNRHRQILNGQIDYRLVHSDTAMQSTHCNSALECRVDGQDAIVATFFHQGTVVAIDRASGDARVLVQGMHNPHSIRRRPGGWVVSDSRACAVVLLDEDFGIEAIIEDDFNWVQDALPVGDSELLIADANHSSLIFWDLKRNREDRRLTFPTEWKIYQVEICCPEWEARFRTAAEIGGEVRSRSV